MKALVVESSAEMTDSVRIRLEDLGFSVVCVCTGAKALEAFNREKPGLVLLNVILPDMDGYDLVRHMRRVERPMEWTPIIFLAPQSTDQDVERGLASGGDDYLVDSVSPAVFAAKVRALQRIASVRESLIKRQHKLEETNESLRSLTSVDGLTGLFNRRHFDLTLEAEWRRCARSGKPLSLLMCDVDYFKLYNDSYGHQAGDECLRNAARAIQSAVKRSGDVVARYGGEEFTVILPETDLVGAEVVARSICAAVANLEIPHKASTVCPVVTVSVGVAADTPKANRHAATLLKAADEALYQAKHDGRNRVQAARFALVEAH